jgi:hypothetical protein
VNNLPYEFTDIRGVLKSHIPAANAPETVEISLEGMYSIPLPNPRNPRKRRRNPYKLVQAKRGCPQRQVTKERALHSHLAVPATTHHEGERLRHTMKVKVLVQLGAQIQIIAPGP